MTIQIAVRLPDELVAAVDAAIAQGLGPTNRTEFVRQALDRYVSELERRVIDAALVASYRSEPDTVDEWGDLGALADGEAADNASALDAWDGGW